MTPEKADQKSISLLSLSIDLSGSTQTKQCIVASAGQNERFRAQLYDEYLRFFAGIEGRLYQQVNAEADVDLAKLFLVKNIGDEFWYVYEVDRRDQISLRRISAALIRAVMATLGGSASIHIPAQPELSELTQNETPDARSTNFDLPLKACLDLLDDGAELNLKRLEFLKETLQKLAANSNEENDRFVTLCNSLNLGSTSRTGTKATSLVRTDYVGWEVDRFFRITKFLKPRILTIGDTLLNALDTAVESIPGFEHLNIKILVQKVPHPGGTGYTTDRNQVATQNIRADELKGVGSPYAVHHLFGLTSLGNAAFMPPAGVQALMEPTRAFLGQHGYYGIPRHLLRP